MEQWKDPASLVRVDAVIHHSRWKINKQVRFYLSSLHTDAEEYNQPVRQH